jgi:hypothetical protein
MSTWAARPRADAPSLWRYARLLGLAASEHPGRKPRWRTA